MWKWVKKVVAVVTGVVLALVFVIRSRFQGKIHIKSIGKNDAKSLEQIINQKMTEYGFGRGYNSNNNDDSRRVFWRKSGDER